MQRAARTSRHGACPGDITAFARGRPTSHALVQRPAGHRGRPGGEYFMRSESTKSCKMKQEIATPLPPLVSSRPLSVFVVRRQWLIGLEDRAVLSPSENNSIRDLIEKHPPERRSGKRSAI